MTEIVSEVFPLVGVKFPNDDGTSRQDILEEVYMEWWTEKREGELQVLVRHDEGNQYDPNAVGVWVRIPEGQFEGLRQVGFIPSDDAPRVLNGLKSRSIIGCCFQDMGAMSGGVVWAKIKVDSVGALVKKRRRVAKRKRAT